MKKLLIATSVLVPLAGLAGCTWMDENLGTNTTSSAPAAGTTAAIAPAAPLTAAQREEGAKELNEVTGMLIDSSKLYAEASGLATDASFKASLNSLSTDRGAQAVKFQEQVRALGGQPVTSGGGGGAWQETLMNVKSVVKTDTQAAVDQVLAAEDGLIEKLNNELANAELAPSTKGFIEGQRNAIMKDRDQVALLKSKADTQAKTQ